MFVLAKERLSLKMKFEKLKTFEKFSCFYHLAMKTTLPGKFKSSLRNVKSLLA